ncbi:hypothetical protein GCG21_05020 [Pseudactinotalea sp. HY160]|nr:hypothetical protein [Pseudactinotalea sp. HY160]
MSVAEIVLLVIAGVAIVAGLLLWHARRLDRLHRRVLDTRAILETQLGQRSEVAAQLAHSGLLDAASSVVVAEAAWQAGIHADRLIPIDPAHGSIGTRAAAPLTGGLDRGQAESDLTVALRAALGEPADRELMAATSGARELLEQVERCCYRAQLARRFHNEVVVAVLSLRGSWFVRFFHLAGRAPLPRPVDMDDAVFDQAPRT